MSKRPLVLCILDGWGYREDTDHNAIAQATTPYWDQLMAEHPHTLLDASGLNVGLPEGQMGNSEVGHMSIGAGRVIFQDLPRIDHAFAHQFFTNDQNVHNFITRLKESGGTCHLMGLLSPGGVHSHINHMIGCARLLNDHGIPTAIHAFLDGRDTAPTSGINYMQQFLSELKTMPAVNLATLGGRFYAMDRDQRWERIAVAYNASVMADAPIIDDPLAYIQKCYDQGIYDEFISPVCLQHYRGMHDDDALWMTNFRADRVRQILQAFVDNDFNHFTRRRIINFAAACGMTSYSDNLNTKLITLFPVRNISHSLGEIISHQELTQFRLAETEKYAHVTFFFNGGRETPFAGEHRHIVPSPRVKTYDLQPEMSAEALTAVLINAINSCNYDFVVVNYANADMVGHSGNLMASITAVEVIDRCLGRIMTAIDNTAGTLLITADHGNIEMLQEPDTHQVHTAHTLNPVPFVIYSQQHNGIELASSGTLVDIAPTILTLLDIPQPSEMTGTSLLF